MTTFFYNDSTVNTHDISPMNQWPFKTYGSPPVTLLKACLKYADKISEIGNEGEDGYWINIKYGFWNPHLECTVIHEHTIKDCLWQLPLITNDPRPENQR
jgi:hypothetical protein